MHRAPDNSRIYAVGDMHGRLDLLRRLHDLIRADAAPFDDRRKVIIYLGDYVDRGPSSKGVLDYLITPTLAGFESVHLKGNHEDLLMRFLEDPEAGPNWIRVGGDATLMSYGAMGGPRPRGTDEFKSIQEKFREHLPSPHLEFLDGLQSFHIEGDYMFVHAGIWPGQPIEDQNAEDMMWIRGEFLQSTTDHGRLIVHGHSITDAPDIRPNRIGIDTGAYKTGRLTCLVLEGAERSFLST